MSERRDPLGIDKLVREVQQKHSATPITHDDMQKWLDNPVTKRMMQELAISIYTSHASDTFEEGRIYQAEQLLNWRPEGLANEE